MKLHKVLSHLCFHHGSTPSKSHHSTFSDSPDTHHSLFSTATSASISSHASSSLHSPFTSTSHNSTPSPTFLYSPLSHLSLSSDFTSTLKSLPFLNLITQDPSHIKASSRPINHVCMATLNCHGDLVSCVALMASNSHNLQLRHDGAIKAVIVQDELVFTSHEDNKIRVWRGQKKNPSANKLLATLPTHMDYLKALLPPQKYMHVHRHKKRLWLQHVDSISVLAVGHSNLLYSGSWDRTIKVWNLSNYRCLESFRAHEDAINALVVSKDGCLYSGSADGKVKVWLKAMGEKTHCLVATLEHHKASVNALALSSDNSILYSGAGDKHILVWETEESAAHISVIGALRGHKRAILCMATIGLDVVCSGSADKTIRVWKREAGNMHSCLAVLHGHTAPIKCLKVSSMNPMGHFWVYSGSLNHTVKVWCVSYVREEECQKEENSRLDEFNCNYPHQLHFQ